MKFVVNLEFGHYFLNLEKSHFQRLKQKFPSVDFINLRKRDERFLDIIKNADALATWPVNFALFKTLMKNAERLKWIQFSYVGVAAEYLHIAKLKKIKVTNARGLASESVALHVLALLLAF